MLNHQCGLDSSQMSAGKRYIVEIDDHKKKYTSLKKNHTEVVAWLICDIKNDRGRKNILRFFLFNSKFIRFWILHSNWVRLNLSMACFIMVCLYGNVIVIVASEMLS